MLTNQRFTIGEMARMHRIPESTLRYYDEKGIFHPSIVDPLTQYRYYTFDQFSMLDTVKFLRHLDIPLKEIKQYMDKRTPSSARELLEKQQGLMIQKQKEIAFMIKKMEDTIGGINLALQSPRETIVFKTIPKRIITSAPLAPNATDDMFEYYIHSLMNNQHLHDVSTFIGTIGVTVSRESLFQGNYQAYNSVFININYMINEFDTDDVIEEGLFACLNHYGPYDRTTKTYEFLLSEIEKHDYDVVGDSIELTLIDLSMTSNAEEYISELQIPVCKRRLGA